MPLDVARAAIADPMGHAGAAWPSFVRYCFEESGCLLPGDRLMAISVDYLESELDRHGARLREPVVSAIVTMRDRCAGLVEAVTRHEVVLITSDGERLRRREYRRSHPDIAGYFRWPLPALPEAA